jgi:CheY-like chemotaxis protein
VKDASTRHAIDRIVAAGLRARDLVHRLAECTRETGNDPVRPVNVNQVVGDVVEDARPRWKDEAQARGVAVEVRTILADVPPILGTRAGLHGIVLNLLINALDALPEGGRITVETRMDKGRVIVRVTDNGIGMAEPVRSRAFEPFFTTKMTVGAGLGLSTAHATVRRWGGSIDLWSHPGQGTRVEVRLPASDPSADSVRPPDSGRPVSHGGPAAILLAEDDEDIVAALGRFAEISGHRIRIAKDGRKALQIAEAPDFDLALIDLSMPGASGHVVAERIKARDPNVVTVLITGWSLDEADSRLAPFDLTCPKPLDLQSFRRIVGQALALRRSRGNRPGS